MKFTSAILSLTSLVGCSARVGNTHIGTKKRKTQGNGMPSGAHYNLNIIGSTNPKTNDGNSGGNVIHVPLQGETHINLEAGNEFMVLDSNGFDEDGATFQLPDPFAGMFGEEENFSSTYSVWVRALGKPGGSAQITTCAVDEEGEEWCSMESVFVMRGPGTPISQDVTAETLTLCTENEDGEVVRMGIFDNSTLDYFWEYNNDGLKLCQMRFYPGETEIDPMCAMASMTSSSSTGNLMDTVDETMDTLFGGLLP